MAENQEEDIAEANSELLAAFRQDWFEEITASTSSRDDSPASSDHNSQHGSHVASPLPSHSPSPVPVSVQHVRNSQDSSICSSPKAQRAAALNTNSRSNSPMIDSSNRSNSPAIKRDMSKDSVKEQAASLWVKAVRLDRKHSLYHAMYYYRQAIKLYADVEKYVHVHDLVELEQDEDLDDIDCVSNDDVDDASTDDDAEEQEAVNTEEGEPPLEDAATMQESFIYPNSHGLCLMKWPQTSRTHISVLPSELLLHIIKWVVSSQIDTRSLYQMSLVCKWFLTCCRDQEIWKLICMRVWGKEANNVISYNNSWFDMYNSKAHLSYIGLYISKNSYFREMPSTSFYSLQQLVNYYKYIRFYPDGLVVICTSPFDPATVIPTLQQRNITSTDRSIVRGTYRQIGETIEITAKYTKKKIALKGKRNQRLTCNQEVIFNIQLELCQRKASKFPYLTWLAYDIETVNKLTGESDRQDISLSQYKPLYFSRVKRYAACSEECL